MALKKDLEGQRFGRLVVLGVHSRTRNGHVRWNCLCDCGLTHSVISTHLLRGLITHCGCEKSSGKLTPQWTGCGDISGDVWYSLKQSASGSKRQKLDFDISIEYAWKLFLVQDRKCALTGELLFFEHEEGIRVRKFRTASLDRVDSGKGYIEGNLQWVHKDINMMKGKLDQTTFINWCSKVSSWSGACEINW